MRRPELPSPSSLGLAAEVAGLALLTAAIGVTVVAPSAPRAVALVEQPGVMNGDG